MQYFVKRGEQKYGPYTLLELQNYVQSGNVLPTDQAQSEGMTDWAPVLKVVGDIMVPSTSYSASSAPAQVPVVTVPLAPNLHWGILFLLVAITRQLFNLIWAPVLANWARKLD